MEIFSPTVLLMSNNFLRVRKQTVSLVPRLRCCNIGADACCDKGFSQYKQLSALPLRNPASDSPAHCRGCALSQLLCCYLSSQGRTCMARLLPRSPSPLSAPGPREPLPAGCTAVLGAESARAAPFYLDAAESWRITLTKKEGLKK